MTTPIYTQCGVRFRSQLEMPIPVASTDAFDVDVRWGDDVTHTDQPTPGQIIAEYDDGENIWYEGARVDDGYLLRFTNCGEFMISPTLDQVTAHRDLNGDHELLPVLLAGTMTSFLLGLRGETVLHASAVEVDGNAIAFVGNSGQGKTTMAALMCMAGARLVTDDVLTVTPGPDVTCLGGASELRLREKAASIVGHDSDNTYTTVDERLAYAPTTAGPDARPLAAIIIPAPDREVQTVSLERLDPSEALFTVIGYPRVYGWSEPDVLKRDFETMSSVVNHVPVYEAVIPWGPPFDPAIAPAILAAMDG